MQIEPLVPINTKVRNRIPNASSGIQMFQFDIPVGGMC